MTAEDIRMVAERFRAEAEDIRRIAERVRAEAEIVPPYERTTPYDFEIFEPLMKMLPKERIPFDPPPRLSDETENEYHIVWTNHSILWTLQYINQYFKVKNGRLPSPSSDIDDDDDVRAQSALYNQERLLGLMKIVDDGFWDRPTVYDNGYIIHREFYEKMAKANGIEEKIELRDKLIEETIAFENGKRGLTYISPSPQNHGRPARNTWESIEDGAGSAAEQQGVDDSVLYPSIERSPERPQNGNSAISSSIEQSHERPRSGNEMEASTASILQNAEPTEVRKRRRLPDEDSALELPLKKQRTDKHPQLSTGLNTAGYKRKRDGEGPLNKLSSTGEPGQPSDKKRRLDGEWKKQVSRKRTRGSQQNDEELRVSQLENEVPGTKRRRVSKAEVTNAEQSVQDASTAAGLATAPSLRITRTRRQQLSGEDAQLVQLDQRGKPEVQGPKHAAQEPAREPARELPAANRSSRRLKKTASMDVKKSRKTKNYYYHQGQHDVPPTMASTTVNTTPKTIARTKFRRASSKVGSKGRLSST